MSIDVDSVAAVIESVGETLNLRQTTAGTYNTTTRSYDSETTAVTPVIGAVIPYDTKEIDGSAVIEGDVSIWFPGTVSVAPAEGNYVERDGTRYRLTRVRSMKIGSDVAYYNANGRGTK